MDATNACRLRQSSAKSEKGHSEFQRSSIKSTCQPTYRPSTWLFYRNVGVWTKTLYMCYGLTQTLSNSSKINNRSGFPYSKSKWIKISDGCIFLSIGASFLNPSSPSPNSNFVLKAVPKKWRFWGLRNLFWISKNGILYLQLMKKVKKRKQKCRTYLDFW